MPNKPENPYDNYSLLSTNNTSAITCMDRHPTSHQWLSTCTTRVNHIRLHVAKLPRNGKAITDLSQGMLVSDAYGGWGCGDLFKRVSSNQSGQET